jgi:hypothetical protein
MITIRDIVKDFLIKNKYDGLCFDDCGCSLSDGLFPCGDIHEVCEVAIKITKKEAIDRGIYIDPDCDVVYVMAPPEVTT